MRPRYLEFWSLSRTLFDIALRAFFYLFFPRFPSPFFTFNFPFISLLSLLPQSQSSLSKHRESQQTTNQQLWIVCIYLRCVCFVAWLFYGLRRWWWRWEHPQVPIFVSQINCLPYFNFPFITSPLSCSRLAIKWAIKCDIFYRDFVEKNEDEKQHGSQGGNFSSQVCGKNLSLNVDNNGNFIFFSWWRKR